MKGGHRRAEKSCKVLLSQAGVGRNDGKCRDVIIIIIVMLVMVVAVGGGGCNVVAACCR